MNNNNVIHFNKTDRLSLHCITQTLLENMREHQVESHELLCYKPLFKAEENNKDNTP